jgi:hypothetical protein
VLRYQLRYWLVRGLYTQQRHDCPLLHATEVGLLCITTPLPR